MESKNLTIMFTDIKGFTQRTSQQSRSATIELLRQHNDLLIPLFESRGGKIIKTIGDAFLVVFESPTNAVLTGIMLQEKLKEHNLISNSNDKLEVRVAINTGEVSLVENDVFGEPVNIASRLEGVSEANEIYFTEATYLAMNKAEVPTTEIGYRHFKGIPDKIKIFKVLKEGHEAPPANSFDDNAARCENQPASPAAALQPKPQTKQFGFIIVPICMLFFGAIFRAAFKSPHGFIFGIGIGFLIRSLEIRNSNKRSSFSAFMGGFFTIVSLGLFLGFKTIAAPLGIAFGLLLMAYFKNF